MQVLIPIVLVLCVLGDRVVAQPAADPPYVAGMPTVERVMAEIRGRDARDTALRQVAALGQLRGMIEEASDGRVYSNELTTGEQRLMAAYGTARSQLRTPIENSLSGNDRSRWFTDLGELERSDEYRDELLERLFSTEWANWYLETVIGGAQARRTDRGSTTSRWYAPEIRNFQLSGESWLLLTVAAVVLFLLGMWRERRAFGADPRDPNGIVAGFKQRKIRTATGTLSDVRHETREYKDTSVSNNPDTWGVDKKIKETTVHCVLRSPELPGGTQPLRFGVGAPIGEGEAATLVWMDSRDPSAYFLLRNHVRDVSSQPDQQLGRFFRPQLWPALPLAWTALMAAALLGASPALSALLAVVAVAAYLGWRARAARRRERAYLQALIGRLDEHANEPRPLQRATPA